MTHTPGPWTTGIGALGIYITADNSQPIAQINNNIEVERNVIAANARLIAAAPDLLTALKEVTELADTLGIGRYGPEELDEVKRARAVIAKAEGR